MESTSLTPATRPALPVLVKDGIFYNLSLALLVLGSLRWNAEMWYQDYPAEVKARFGPQSEKAKRQAQILTVPFFLIAIGGLVVSALREKAARGGTLAFGDAFRHIYALAMSFWLVDLTLIDWLLMVRFTPSWVMLPGTEDMPVYKDYGYHLRAHTKAVPGLALGCAVLALVAVGLARVLLHPEPGAR